MPGYTPLYGFPFPLMGETVSATDFQNLSTAIDAQLTLLKTNETLVRVKATCSAVAPAQTIAQGGVDVQFTSGQWVNPAAFHSTTVNPQNFQVQANGIYYVAANMQISATTVTQFQIFATANGTRRWMAGAEPVQNTPTFGAGAFASTAGETITINALWFGTGTGTVSGWVQIFQLSAF